MAEINNEKTKRVLYIALILFIIVLAIISLIGSIILSVMKYQGKLIDREISDPIRRCRLVQDDKHFMKYAVKKNKLLFFQQALAPIGIILIGVAVLLLYVIIGDNWGYNPWSMDNGFGSLFITWDFSTIIRRPEDGVGLLINWPEVSHSPTFNIDYWCGYVSCTLFIVGGLWYLYAVQGLMGRTFRILRLRKTIFDKSLENFNLNDETLENFKQQ